MSGTALLQCERYRIPR